MIDICFGALGRCFLLKKLCCARVLDYSAFLNSFPVELQVKMAYDAHDDGPGFVGIRFCQECNNMLYPKEDKENKILL